ncbi:hypothetical protein JKP88DRAFT_287946 [Tribonema minus]|uniref:Uncharacterized protein n=1 Tax=Tribonema minus TaxID=303371 RepID=A0A836CID7_9STRA|nr:hypothetical protein JKP88DRAFT_287946 [Tribonema minus]
MESWARMLLLLLLCLAWHAPTLAFGPSGYCPAPWTRQRVRGGLGGVNGGACLTGRTAAAAGDGGAEAASTDRWESGGSGNGGVEAASTDRKLAFAGDGSGEHRQESEALQKLSWLRAKTDGNGLRHDCSTVDSPPYRAIWAEHAPKILELLPQSAAAAVDGDMAQAYTEAIMYKTSSKGIISGIASGNAFAFLNAVEMLVSQYPQQDNGVAFIFQGAYYLAAPWPVKSAKKAVAAFEKALGM